MSTIPMTHYPTQGWQCPVCRAVYSPTVPSCFSCKPKKYSAGTGIPFDPDIFKTYEGSNAEIWQCDLCGCLGAHYCTGGR
jgi:hypothetical protein